MTTERPLEADVLQTARSHFQRTLPPGWRLEPRRGLVHSAGPVITQWALTAPSGENLVLAVAYQPAVVVRDLPRLMDDLERHGLGSDNDVPVIVSRYLSRSVRDSLDSTTVSYADATGNLRLVAATPALYVRDRGADKDPWRGPGRPRSTLKGDPAARVVRALADYIPPIPVTKLVRLAEASTGGTYRVLDFLEQEDLLIRGQRGSVEHVRWRRMLTRWADDTADERMPSVGYLQPRGVSALLGDLPTMPQETPYVVSGSLAAQQWAPYASPRLAMLYVRDTTLAAEHLGLRVVDKGANVLLLRPTTPAVFHRWRDIDGIRYAAPSQVAVDLLGGPGRSPAEGEELLNWMENHELAWRREPLDRGAQRTPRRL